MPERIDGRQAKWFVAVFFGAAVCGGILVAQFLMLPATYATMLCAAMLFPLAAFVLGNTRRLLLAMLAMLLPITVDITLNHSGHVGGTAGYVVSAYDAVLVALYVLWFGELVRRTNGSPIRFFPEISIPALLLILAGWLSALGAERPDLSIYEMIEVSKMYLTFFYLANNIRSRDDVKFLLLILILGLLFEGVLGYAQRRTGEAIWPTALGGPPWVDSRLMGTWRSPNDFSWYLTFVLPIAACMFVGERGLSWRILCGASLAFGTAVLMWTNSRSGWLSFAVALLFVGLLLFFKTQGRRLLIGRFFMIVLVLVVASPLYPRVYDKMLGRFMGDDGGAAESRIPQFQMAYAMIMDRPAFGVGINNYIIVMHQYDYTEEGILSLTAHPVHNIFLHLGAEIGLIGLMCFLGFIGSVYVCGMRRIAGNRPVLAHGTIGMLGGILAFLVHGLYDVEGLGGKLYLFIWFFCGVICATKVIGEAERRA